MGPPSAEHVAGEPEVDLSSAEYFDHTGLFLLHFMP
jgi:hypothetical protein